MTKRELWDRLNKLEMEKNRVERRLDWYFHKWAETDRVLDRLLDELGYKRELVEEHVAIRKK